jgi:hypothetical protein
MVHKPKHKVHSFRGLLDDGGQAEINLERQNNNVAYRIVKMATIGSTYGASNQQSVIKVYREEQSATTSTIDFNDVDLLAVGVTSSEAGVQNVPQSVIFDNTLFVRNLYVTHVENVAALLCNYYIELEEVPVTSSTLMQLKLGVARKLNLQQD